MTSNEEQQQAPMTSCGT